MALEIDTVTGVPGVYRRSAAGAAGFPRLRTDVVGLVGVAGPNHLGELIRVDDWRSYQHLFLRDDRGHALEPPAGARLATCVRDFFANGGARCWVVNVGERIEASEASPLLERMLGTFARTGLELLLTRREVAIVALPELEAMVPASDRTLFDAPLADQSRFGCCRSIHDLPPLAEASQALVAPLYQPAEVLGAQRYLIERCGREKWRVFALVTPPSTRSAADAVAWRDALTRNLADTDAAALYWPWVKAQERPGAPVELRPPIGFVAGVFARRDLARGPHVAPANERLLGVIGVETTVDDTTHGQIYARGINVLRPMPNLGIQVWGARTLLWPSDDPLGWINVRRCLSAIERTVDLIGQGVVFEPNQPLVRFQLSQAIWAYLLELHQAGAFKGDTPERSYFVRCDASNNPRRGVEQGQLICDVGVAIAEPAEFIVFRVGRRAGVIEIEEAA